MSSSVIFLLLVFLTASFQAVLRIILRHFSGTPVVLHHVSRLYFSSISTLYVIEVTLIALITETHFSFVSCTVERSITFPASCNELFFILFNHRIQRIHTRRRETEIVSQIPNRLITRSFLVRVLCFFFRTTLFQIIPTGEFAQKLFGQRCRTNDVQSSRCSLQPVGRSSRK